MMKKTKVSLWSVFCRQSWWLILCCLILFSACFFGLPKVPPIYRAQAVINVEKSEYALAELAFRAEGTETAVGNAIHFLRSEALLDKTLRQLGYRLNRSHFKLLRHLLRIDRVTSGSLIKVSLFYHSPREASMIVNTLVETLMAEEKENRLCELAEAKSYLTDELEKIKKRKTQTVGEVRTVSQRPIRPAAKVQHREYLQTVDGDIRYTRDKILYYLTALHDHEKKAVEEVLTPEHWILKSARTQFEMEEEKLVKSLIEGGWNAPQVKKVMSEIWRLKMKTADTYRKHYNPKLPGPDNIKNALYIFYINLYDLQIRREKLLSYGQPSGTATPVRDHREPVPQEGILEEKAWQDTETKLLSRLLELEAIAGMVSSDLCWVERAAPPQEPFFPSRHLVLGISLSLVFIFTLVSLIVGYSHDKEWQRVEPGKDLD